MCTLTNETKTDEDSQQIFQALLHEKKKNLELEQRIRELEEEAYAKGIADVPSPYHLAAEEVETIQKKLKAVQQAYSESEEELKILKAQFITLRTVAQQSKEEATKLRAQLQAMDHTKSDEVEELDLQKQRLDKLMTLLHEREKRIADLQQFEAGNRKVFDTLAEKNKEIESLREEKEQLQSQWEEVRRHCEQLERVVQHLRERSEEANLEVNQLQQETQASLSTIEMLQNEIKNKDIALAKFAKQLHEEENAKADALDELKAVQAQQALIKNRMLSLQVDAKKREVSTHDLSQLLEALRNEKAVLEEEVRAKAAQIDETHVKFNELEEQLALSHEDLTKLQANYKEALNANTSLKEHTLKYQEEINYQKSLLEQDKKTIESLQKEHDAANERLQQLEGLTKENQVQEQKIHNLTNEISECTRRIDQLQHDLEGCHVEKDKLRRLIDEHDQVVKGFESRIADAKKENALLQENQATQAALIEEKEGKLRIAHQHLAKKVKETTLLTEKIEEQNNRNNDLQQSLDQTLSRLNEMEMKFNQAKIQEKNLSDQLQDIIRGSEQQQRKWEEKYFLMYDKWQSTDASNAELKKIEAKYQQLKGFLGNLNHFMDTVHHVESIAVNHPHEVITQEMHIKEPPAISKISFGDDLPSSDASFGASLPVGDLFSNPKTASKSKNSLFD